MPNSDALIQRAFGHVKHLSSVIGPRPATGEGERLAMDYASDVLMLAGLHPRIEAFIGGRSKYDPYALAVATGLLGAAVQFVTLNRLGALVGMLLTGLGAWMLFRESEQQPHAGRRLLAQRPSQNVVSVSRATGDLRKRVVICANADTHRTPPFSRSARGATVLSAVLLTALLCLIVNLITFGASVISDQPPLPVIGLVTNPLLILAFVACVLPELTPYSTGANDNASGCATALSVGERLGKEPLQRTDVWIVVLGCQEPGSHGVGALLDAHGDDLREAQFICLQAVGIGALQLLTRSGPLLPTRPNGALLQLARQTSQARPGLLGGEIVAHDAAPSDLLSHRGYKAITLSARPAAGSPAAKAPAFRQQTADTIEHVEIDALQRAHDYVWALLQKIDEI